MKYALYVGGVICGLLGGVSLLFNATTGLLFFLISAVLFSGGAVVEALQRMGDDVSVSRQTLTAMMREVKTALEIRKP